MPTQVAPRAGEPPPEVRFGAFRLDLRAGLLYRGAQPLPLRPKTWAVLLHLARRPGALVTRDELLDAVWPDVAVTPDTLTKSIGELRQVLGDDPSAPRFIATVHRRGFRFLAAGDPAPTPWQPAEPRRLPFVGRAVELQRLQRAYQTAVGGTRQIVFVTGAAGVGKTRLCQELLAALPPGADPWIGRAGCIEQHGLREPYMPVLSALERLARRADGERLVALLRHTAPTWLAQMPWLLGDEETALRQALQAARPERMLRELAVLTEALTRDVTLVLLLEDLHWSDPATVDLLLELAARDEPARLLVIGTFRPADLVVTDHVLAHAARHMRSRRQCVEIPLHDLAGSDVDDYLAARFPGADAPAGLSDRLHRYTDGNPLFVGAVVEHLVARGLVLDTAPGWAFSPGLEQAELGVPDDARRMIEVQYHDLSPGDRELLAAASVVGQSFLPDLVAAALGLPAEQVEARCEALARTQRLLCFETAASEPERRGGLRVAFAHELHRRAVYDGIPDAARQRLHRRVGEALEALYAENAATPPAAMLAAHFEHGGDPTRAVGYLIAAAEQAQRRFAAREAISSLDAALTIVARCPDPTRRDREELALRLRLWPLLCDRHGMASETLRGDCERALVLCDRAGTDAQRFEIVYALCHVYGMRADRELAPRFTAELMRLAERLADDTTRTLAESVALRLGMMQGRYAETVEHGARLFARGDFRRRQPTTQLSDALIDSVMHYAQALWFRGQTSAALAVSDAGIEAALAHCSIGWQAICHGHRGLTALFCRDGAMAADAARRTLVVANREGFEFGQAFASVLDCGARMLAGDSAGALVAGGTARDQLAASGSRVLVTVLCALLAEAHLQAGDCAAGLRVVADGLRVGDETLERLYVPELWRVQGLLLRAAAPRRRGRAGREAEAALRRAVEMARAAGALSLELRATTSLAAHLADQGQGDEAITLLAAAIRPLPLDPANRDADEAARLLAALGGAAPA
ncbi:AAA family ATPase [bacterium]|nr:AAA family ATPase [bacterium]